MDEIACEVQECHKPHRPWQIRFHKNFWQNFAHNLKTPFWPAELLFLECLHLRRKLSWYDHIGQITNPPTAHLSAITQVEIFSERIPLPSTSIFNASAAPYSARSVEIQKEVVARTNCLFDDKMSVNAHCLCGGQ